MNLDLHIIWILFVVGLALVTGELFIPGGIVGVIGFILVLVAIGCAFYQSATFTAVAMIVTAIVVIPAGFILLLPRLSMNAELSREDGFVEGTSKHEWMGRVGRTVSPLRPMGTAEFEGQRLSVQAEHGMVESGVEVTVVRVEGNCPFVRPVES